MQDAATIAAVGSDRAGRVREGIDAKVSRTRWSAQSPDCTGDC